MDLFSAVTKCVEGLEVIGDFIKDFGLANVFLDELSNLRFDVGCFDVDESDYRFGGKGCNFGGRCLGISKEEVFAFDAAKPPTAAAEGLVTDFDTICLQEQDQLFQNSLFIHFMCRLFFAVIAAVIEAVIEGSRKTLLRVDINICKVRFATDNCVRIL